MVKQYSQLYLEARRALLVTEDQQTASLYARELLCHVSGKTQEHVTRSMRKYMGQTPSTFVNAIRLERVAEALTTTERPVFDIMLDVGFQNTSHFNKLFKEKYHMSPRKYRASATNILGQAE